MFYLSCYGKAQNEFSTLPSKVILGEILAFKNLTKNFVKFYKNGAFWGFFVLQKSVVNLSGRYEKIDMAGLST